MNAMPFYNLAAVTARISRSRLSRASRPFFKLRLPSAVPHQLYDVATDSRRKYFNTNSGPESNWDVLGHTTGEAGEYDKLMGEMRKDLSRGTSLQDTQEFYAKSNKYAPNATNDDIRKKTELGQDVQDIVGHSAVGEDFQSAIANTSALGQLENVSNTGQIEGPDAMKISYPAAEGHKFGLPELPIPSNGNLKYRDDPIVQQVTNLLMKDGKKSVAQRNMSFILNALRTASPPKFHPTRLLIPGHPPAHHLPLDPVGYLTLAIDSIAPLLRIRSERGAAGGGAALQIPVPLGKKQRRRQAVMWILDSANKKPNRSSGRGTFAQRFADEIISVVEGRSSTWEKRLMVHKTGTTARNNVNFRRRRK